jgi:hypothetical protein
VTSDTEHTQRVNTHIKTAFVKYLERGSALIAIEYVRGAFKASHVASLLLGNLLDGVHGLLALFAIDGGVIAAAINIRDIMLFFAFAWLATVVTMRANDVNVHKLRQVGIISASLQEGTLFAVLFNVDGKFRVVPSGSRGMRCRHENFTCQLG